MKLEKEVGTTKHTNHTKWQGFAATES